MTAHQTVSLVPYSDDIRAVAARQIMASATSLPDLTNSLVLLPDLQFAPRLRRHLLDAAASQGHAALLGPDIRTIDQWLSDNLPLDQSIPGRERREILLVEVLRQHPNLFHGGDPWQISS